MEARQPVKTLMPNFHTASRIVILPTLFNSVANSTVLNLSDLKDSQPTSMSFHVTLLSFFLASSDAFVQFFFGWADLPQKVSFLMFKEFTIVLIGTRKMPAT